MNRNLETLEKEIRASKTYHDWKRNNKSIICIKCGSLKKLELHHIIPLHVMVKYIYVYCQDKKQTIKQILEMHKNNTIHSATLCENCHTGQHKHRTKNITENSSNPPGYWCAAPRNIEFLFSHKKSSNRLNLIPFQILLILGYYILNKQIKKNLIIINWIEMTKLIGKKTPSSWKISIERALENLKNINIIDNYTFLPNKKIKIYLNKNYIKNLSEKPWFFPLSDVASSSMLMLSLKWFLSTVKNHYKKYSIDIDKLKNHLGTTDNQSSRIISRIKEACKNIKWIKEVTNKDTKIIFKLTSRPIPVNTLWNSLDNNLDVFYP